MVTKYSVAMGLIAVADSDLQIRGGGHPDPDIRGVVSVWSNDIGGGAFPGSASELPTKSINSIQILSLFK